MGQAVTERRRPPARPRTRSGRVAITVLLGRDVYALLRREARDTKLSQAQIVEDALRAELPRREALADRAVVLPRLAEVRTLLEQNGNERHLLRAELERLEARLREGTDAIGTA